ncbi:MAG TPA: VOC family protein [Acidimicrobiia bacterium]|nr:VOC family protein [Acidimicrobiia bacterium]
MAIATYRCTVLDVDDLTVAYKFWSEVTGLEIIGSPGGWHGRFGYLGRKDPWKHEFILQVVDTPKGERANRVHIDLTPNQGMDRAIEDIIALGGSVKKPPTLYPRPGSHGDEPPVIEWAVMQDPFGNEFCLVSALDQREIEAVLKASMAGASTDHELRVVAGRTS